VHVIDAPGARTTRPGLGTVILSGSNHGALCGDLLVTRYHTEAWVRYRGKFHVFDLHPSVTKAATEAYACNDHGKIGGRSAAGTTSKGFTAKV
jgi:hypothetical protein